MSDTGLVWLQFSVCAALLGAAGYQLSRYGDVIAQRSGLSGGWIGLALLATVTSLPELVTGITSVTGAQAPNLAIGDALGSCVVNLVFLVFIDLFLRKEPIWQRTSRGHVLASAFGVVMLSLTLMMLQLAQVPVSQPSDRALQAMQYGFNAGTVGLLVLYLVAMRTVFTYEKGLSSQEAPIDNPEMPPMKLAIQRFLLAATAVIGAGIWLPFVSVDLANKMGWNNSFVGSLFVALVTSLPELTVTLAALQLGALNMAIGNLLGSNLFNVAIIAIDDMVYTPGTLFSAVSPVHAVTATSAISMTGLALIGLFFKPVSRVLRLVGWISIGLLAIYLLNTSILYLYGE
jgi:cation:H+ antiporter